MPDNNNTNDRANILAQLGIGSNNRNDPYLDLLRSIADTLDDIKNGTQSSRFSAENGRSSSTTFRDRYRDRNDRRRDEQNDRRTGRNGFSGVRDSFLSGFHSEFTDPIKRKIGTLIRDQLGGIYNSISNELGISLKDAPNALGRAVGLKLKGVIKSSGIDTVLESALNDATHEVKDHLFNKVSGIPGVTESIEQIKKAYIQGRDAAGVLHTLTQNNADPATDFTDTDQGTRRRDTTQNTQTTSRTQAQHWDRAPSIKNDRQATRTVEQIDLVNCCCCNADMLTGKDDILASALESISNGISVAHDRSVNDALNTVTDATNGNLLDLVDVISDVVGGSSSGLADITTTAAQISGEGSAAIAGFSSAIDAAIPMIYNAAATAGPMILKGLMTAEAALAPVVTALAPIVTALPLVGLALVTGYVAFNKLNKILAPVKENFKKLSDEVKRTADRVKESRTKNADLAIDRLQKDVEVMVKKPFEILQAAAEEWYSTWNSNLKVITATQGYSKADLQTLMGNYAERLRKEGLQSYVSASDISNNLASVLKEGLSGKVAEEFAYIATKLNNAIPTQDFFQSASSYASIVANAVKDGKSQSDAIKLANDTLMQMASNVLYASRELTSGVTTGLKDAQSIMERSIQIAQTGKTDNAVAINGVLTSVSAIVGSIAPDLASAMTDAVYKAAVGGNSSDIVALRSLAGINASNTEFLRQLSDDPKKVFVDLFDNLGRMQNMSNDAYMEVAEGLSSIFGLSMDTFARVDFDYLSKAIANMSTTSNAIADNLDLLMSGQTTTTAEQLKIQQINKYMIDEGLAYVIDNEAAQMIQQHMWDEQIARDIMEAQYSVDLAGSSLQFIESIAGAIDNILMFLNPIGWITKLGRLIVSTTEQKAMDRDIKQMLELGKVGTGQELSKYQLTTRNRDLALTNSLVGLMGGISEYSVASGIGNIYSTIGNLGTTLINNNNALSTAWSRNVEDKIKIDQKKVNSSYSWGSIGKSTASVLNASTVGPHLTGLSDIQMQESEITNTALAQAKAEKNLQDMFDSMDDFVRNDKDYSASYEDWVATAKKYGISDFSAAIEDAGITDERIRSHFEGLKLQIGAQIRADREGLEESFWDASRENLVAINETSVSIRDITDLIRQTGEAHLLETIDFKNITSEILTNIFDMSSKIYDEFLKFYASWVDYYVDHTAYSSAYDHETVSKIQREEKAESEDAVYALADALTKNTVDLLDPTVQTNALLSQILKVANAILNATNTPNGTTIPDSLSGMALGLTSM